VEHSSPRLAKIANKVGINESQLRDIIVYEHDSTKLMKRKDFKEIHVNLEPKSAKLVARIAKALKVSESSVMAVALIAHLKKEGKL
jgi:hypothetical protein